jgi:hypothetical protein
MAILNRGFDQTNLMGSVGGVTYRRVGGVTVASQKVPMHVQAKQTPKLMYTRMRWVNLVALWKAINTTSWHPSFRKDNSRQSDFNLFMKVNMTGARTFITRGIATANGAVVAPVTLTSPSTLKSIEVEFGNNSIPESSLAVGSLTIGNSTTLQTFSQAIIDNNSDWQSGDQLTILLVRQMVNNGIPVALATEAHVILDNSAAAATKLLSEQIEPSFLSVVDGTLALSGPVLGGVAFVQSRLVGGETICSGQSLVVENTYLQQYQGETAFRAAVDTYGGFATNELLTPDLTDDIISQLEP